MNVFGQRERSWRKSRKRAVSPIIATILLVAITVVLAAVLYVLISGLTHGPGSTPIGSAFSAGNPTSSNTGYTGAADACAAGTTTIAAAITANHWTYTLTVESSTVTFGSPIFQVKTAAGAVAAPAGYQGFWVVNIAGNVVACAITTGNGGLSMGSGIQFTYTTVGALTSSSPLTSVYTIVIDMGTVNPAGTGYTFDAVGQGSYSGTTSALPLP
jgi:flagellin-like protein